MAYQAELLRRKWSCICGMNLIKWYSKKLYDEWYASLTEGQKYELELQRRREEARRGYESRTALAQMGVISSILSSME